MKSLRVPVLVVGMLAAVMPSAAQIEWQPSNVGLDGAGLTSLLVTGRGSIVAGTDCGMYRYDHSSERWTMTVEYVSMRTISNERAGLIFAIGPTGAFRSTDTGSLWTPIGRRLAEVSIAEDGCVYAVSGGRFLYRSSDDGVSWDSTTTAGPVRSVLALSCDELFVTGDEVYRSTNGGTSLEPLAFTASSVRRLPSGVLYVVGEEPRVSTDGGRSWMVRSQPWPEDVAELPDGELVGVVRWSQTQPDPGLYASRDLGVSWRRVLGGDFDAVEAVGRDLWLARGSHAERFRLGDSSLVERNAGLTGIGLRQMSVDSSSTIYGVGGSGGVRIGGSIWKYLYRSTNDGAQWTRVGDSVQTLVASHEGGVVFAVRGMRLPATPVLPLSVSTDGGVTWRALAQPRASYDVRASGDTIVVHHANSSAPWSALSSSIDRGRTWSTIALSMAIGEHALVPGGRLIAAIRRSAITPSPALMFSDDGGRTWSFGRDDVDVVDLVTTSDGTAFALAVGARTSIRLVLRSDDRGATWTNVYTELQNEPFAIDVDPRGRLWLSGRSRALRSSDRGATWELVTVPVGLQQQSYRLRFGSTGDIWFDDPVVRSTDDGVTWTQVDGINEVAMTPSGWLIGSSCRTYRSQAGIASVPSTGSTPTTPPSDALTVAPNPAIGRTTVTVRIAGGSDFVLRLCDLAGRDVMVVREGRAGSSSKSIEIETDCLATGTYIIQLETPNWRASRRVIVR